MSPARTGAPRPWGEVVAFAVLTLIGVAVVLSSFGYGILLERNRIGPGFLPLVLGVLLVALGAAQLVSRLRLPAADGAEHHHQEAPVAGAAALLEVEHEAPPESDVDIMGRSARYRTRQLWLVVAGIAVTITVVPYLGFLTAFGALILFISIVVERRRVVPAVLVTLAAIGVVYGVFGAFLDVPLPAGPLGI
ncbi:MAG: tripartite tricarboxylate transporter TctB family protein [Actinomycetes bacterium]